MQPVVLLVKPADGCNISCIGCFTEKERSPGLKSAMSTDTLRILAAQYIEASPSLRAWKFQGGEPTLLSLEWYELAQSLDPGAMHMLQTNGLTLWEDWFRFLAEHDWLVGISLNGAERHNAGRGGKAQYHRVVESVKALKSHGVRFNILCTVGPWNQDDPAGVWEALRELSESLQFIPAQPAGSSDGVDPGAFQAFLEQICTLADPDARVRNLEDSHRTLIGASTACELGDGCGYPVVTWNGSVYPCDFETGNPDWLLGNIHERRLELLLRDTGFARFAYSKRILSDTCRACEWRKPCLGGCPFWRRMARGDVRDLEPLCESRKTLFRHVTRKMLKRKK